MSLTAYGGKAAESGRLLTAHEMWASPAEMPIGCPCLDKEGDLDRFSADPTRLDVAAFFDAAKPVEAAYRNDVVSFVAVKHMDVFILLQARLVRSTDASIETRTFTTDLVTAGRYRLADVGVLIHPR